MKKNDIVDAIFEAYGLPESSKVPARVKYIEEWNRPNIKYTERLMGIWKGKGIQTMDAAKAAVSELRTKRASYKAERTEKRQEASGTRMFRNFTERQNNNYMEKVLEKYRSGEYYGS